MHRIPLSSSNTAQPCGQNNSVLAATGKRRDYYTRKKIIFTY
ncbi:hypothetical protein DSUL_60041 [Desulfovibrionales bacterium]